MNNLKVKSILMFSLMFILVFSGSLMAQDEVIDPEVPESWYEAPKTASEMGIESFQQAPMLKEEVEAGNLPPVADRLPDDPPVIETYGEVGEYGGEAIVWNTKLKNLHDAAYMRGARSSIGRKVPDGSKVVPHFLKGWEFSEDNKKVTLYLRKDMKWSDGEVFDANYYTYWWEYHANNEDLSPTPPEEMDPPLVNVTKEGKWEVTFHYGEPVPEDFTDGFATSMLTGWDTCYPPHVLKNYHPEFAGEEATKKAKKAGYDKWSDYYTNFTGNEYNSDKIGIPTIKAYVPVKVSETSVVFERNPYFPFVDQEGNQLPYIDKLRVELANSPEMASTKAATGEATFAARNLNSSDLPLYKTNEKKENYKTLTYSKTFGSDCAIQLNLTHEDPQYRSLFNNFKFRKALSYAIDREEINEKVYLGLAIPRQATVSNIHPAYKKEYAEAYAEYKPEKAKELLNEIGMKDVDNDGNREFPNGDEFFPEFMYTKFGPVEPTGILELVLKQWKEVGIDVNLKKVKLDLNWNRKRANNWDISGWTFEDVVKFLAPLKKGNGSPWTGWTDWFNTDGEEGMEPPKKVKELYELGKIYENTRDPEKRKEAIDKLVKAQSENLWHIGTVGMAPQPVIIDENLKNVPKRGLWDFSVVYMQPFYPFQFYLEGE